MNLKIGGLYRVRFNVQVQVQPTKFAFFDFVKVNGGELFHPDDLFVIVDHDRVVNSDLYRVLGRLNGWIHVGPGLNPHDFVHPLH